MIKITIPASPAKIIGALEKYGYEAYVVGGCVRDAMLGREPNDWDVTTSCPAVQTMEIFERLAGFEVYPTGIEHGTVTVTCDGEAVEVTTFRIDLAYTDHRHPNGVCFSENLSEDLARRDFTVCAMAYSERSGLVDIYGGAADIESRVIRCVGDPKRRFGEDALRIMRALRFASQLGFAVDRETADAARALAHTLVHISRERITSELSKLLLGVNAAKVMSAYADILSFAAPMLKTEETTAAGEVAGRLGEASLPLMLACLLSFSDEETVDNFFKWLRFDNKTVRMTKNILSVCPTYEPDRITVKRMCRDVGFDGAESALRLAAARGDIQAQALDTLRKIRDVGECCSLMQLDIDGHDIIALGCMPCFIGDVLDMLLDKVILCEIENDKAALIRAAKGLMDEDGYIPERK